VEMQGYLNEWKRFRVLPNKTVELPSFVG